MLLLLRVKHHQQRTTYLNSNATIITSNSSTQKRERVREKTTYLDSRGSIFYTTSAILESLRVVALLHSRKDYLLQ